MNDTQLAEVSFTCLFLVLLLGFRFSTDVNVLGLRCVLANSFTGHRHPIFATSLRALIDSDGYGVRGVQANQICTVSNSSHVILTNSVM
ncbi:hypothetical protein V1522DRAFT_411598, partial [Lipomyces starkeyi]